MCDHSRVAVSFYNLISDEQRLSELSGYQLTPEWIKQRLGELGIEYVDLLMIPEHADHSLECLAGKIIWSTTVELPHDAYGLEVRDNAIYVPRYGHQAQGHFFRLISKMIQTRDVVSLEDVGMIDLFELYGQCGGSDCPSDMGSDVSSKLIVSMGLAKADHGILPGLILFKVGEESLLRDFLDPDVQDGYLSKAMERIFKENPYVDISISLYHEWSCQAYIAATIERLGQMREEALSANVKN